MIYCDYIYIFQKKNPEQIKQNPKTKCPIFNSLPKKLEILSSYGDLNPNIFCSNTYSKIISNPTINNVIVQIQNIIFKFFFIFK